MQKIYLAFALTGVLVVSSASAEQQLDQNSPAPKPAQQQAPPHKATAKSQTTTVSQPQPTPANASNQQTLQPNLKSNALSFSVGDKTYSITIFGQVFVNHSIFGGAYNIDGFGNGHTAQQTQLESARLGVTGNLLKNWTYAVYFANRASAGDPDDNSDVYVRNAFIQYTGWQKYVILTAGKQNPPWGVDNMHDSINTYGTNFSMMTQAFAPPIATGISAHGNVDAANIVWDLDALHTGVVTRDSASNPRGGQGYENESRMYVARVGYSPLMDLTGNRLFFISGSYVHYNGSDDPVSSIVVNGNVSGTLADNGNPPVTAGPFAPNLTQNYSDLYDAGFSSEWGPFTLEGEYAWMRTSLNGGLGTVSAHYNGGFVQAGYVITGESRTFDAHDGYMLGVLAPTHRYGAWEVFGRVGRINLVSDAGKNDTAIGDRATAYTLGVDWYLNRHIRFAIDGSHLQLAGPSAQGQVRTGNGGTIQAGYVF